MNEPALRWLLDPQNPSVRYQTLVDVLGRAPESKEAVEARNRIPRYSVVKRIMSLQSKAGYWPRKNSCDSPRFTGALWALMLLGEMAIAPDQRVEKEREWFFDLHQAENGAFTYLVGSRGRRPTTNRV